MKYKCKTVNILKMIPTYEGFFNPLCDNCKTKDCENPIEKRKISILGIQYETRMFVKGDQISMVVSCEGFTSE